MDQGEYMNVLCRFTRTKLLTYNEAHSYGTNISCTPFFVPYKGKDKRKWRNFLRKQSSGMWHNVEVVLTDVSEERITSIFRVEGKIWKSAREASVRDVCVRGSGLDLICIIIQIFAWRDQTTETSG
jgi:hypothetical protein